MKANTKKKTAPARKRKVLAPIEPSSPPHPLASAGYRPKEIHDEVMTARYRTENILEHLGSVLLAHRFEGVDRGYPYRLTDAAADVMRATRMLQDDLDRLYVMLGLGAVVAPDLFKVAAAHNIDLQTARARAGAA